MHESTRPNALNDTVAAIAGDDERTLTDWITRTNSKFFRQVLTLVLYFQFTLVTIAQFSIIERSG